MIDSSVKIPFGIPKTRGERLGWAGPHQEVWRYIVDWYQCCWTKPEVRWKLRSSIAMEGGNMSLSVRQNSERGVSTDKETFKRLKRDKASWLCWPWSATRDISDIRRLADDDPAGNPGAMDTLWQWYETCVSPRMLWTQLALPSVSGVPTLKRYYIWTIWFGAKTGI